MQKDYFVLDNTLRYLYITLRNRGAQILGIEFIHRGKKWKADTPEEAIRLRQKLEAIDNHAIIYGDEDLMAEDDQLVRAESVWTPDVFWSFIQEIGYSQK